MTDMNLIRALLGTKRLAGAQEKAFKDMLQDMIDGKLVKLSKKQREWADKLFTDLGLHGKPLTLAAAPAPRKPFDAPKAIWDQPKPLKPPGRS